MKDTICSKSEILSVLTELDNAPDTIFPIQSIIGTVNEEQLCIAEGIGKDTTERLVHAISQQVLPNLTNLNVADNDMGTSITAELINCLRAGACPSLHTLILHDNRIGSTIGSLLADLLNGKSRCYLSKLDIKHNRLKQEGLMTIMESLYTYGSSFLNSFLFSDNDETQSVLIYLFDLIAEGHLPSIDQIEWTDSLTPPVSFTLLCQIQKQAPKLTLPFTSITCT